MNSGKAKRFLGWILAVAMVVSILPTAAFAEGEDTANSYTVEVGNTTTFNVDGLYKTSDITVSSDSSETIVTVTSEQKITTPPQDASLGEKLTPTENSVTGVISDGNGNYMKWTKTLATSSDVHYAIDTTTEFSEATVWTFEKQDGKETYLISYTDNSTDNSTTYYMTTGTGTVKLYTTSTTVPTTGWACSEGGGLTRTVTVSSNTGNPGTLSTQETRTIVYDSDSDSNYVWTIRATSSDTNGVLGYLYSVNEATEAVGTTDITVKGVAAGTATLTVGGNTYTINVTAPTTTDPDPEPGNTDTQTTETVDLEVGDTKTYTISGANYADSYTGEGLDTAVATVEVTGTDGVTATEAGSITSGSSYAIGDGSGNYLSLDASGTVTNTTNAAAATKWTVTSYTYESSGTSYTSYYVSATVGDTTYYLCYSGGLTAVTSKSSSLSWFYDEYGFYTYNAADTEDENCYYLSCTNGTWQGQASEEDTGCGLYTATTTDSAYTTVEITGVAAGTTSVTVGNTTYNITVIDTSNPASQDGKPTDGTTTTGQPFASGTGGSTNFRIPAIVTLSNGTLVAAADARWNNTADGYGLDTVVARSSDKGATWSYTFANYLGDNGNVYNTNSTAFIDPALATDGTTVYMLVDLYPAGGIISNLNAGTGYDSAGHLLLQASDGSSYDYYLDGNTIYTSEGVAVNGYVVDEYFNIFYLDEDGNTVSSNLFFANSPYKVLVTSYLYLTKSTDGGETWSAPTMLNSQVKNANETFYGVGPGGGTVTSTGRIIFPCYTYTTADGNTSVIYSDDGGVTWTRSANMTNQTSEATVSEVTVGDKNYLYMFTRHGGYYVSSDNGTTWGSVQTVSGISYTTSCELSTLTYSQLIDGRPAILLSAPTSSRTTGKIFVGLVQDDGSIIWKYTYEVNGSGTYQYSDLTELSDGTIGLLYENSGSSITYTTLSIETIADGATIGEIDPDNPNAPKTETVKLTVGASATYTISGANYAGSYTGSGLDTAVATVTVTGQGGATAAKATSITANSSYAISDGSGNYLTLNGTTVTNTTDPAEAVKWTVTESEDYSGYYTITTTVNGTTYYLLRTTDTAGTLSVSTSSNYWRYNSTNGYFYTYNGNTNYYLYCNDGSWTFSTSSTSSNLAQPYTVTTDDTTKASTTVVINGVASGKTSVTVGNTTYNITVTAAAVGSSDSVPIEVLVGQTVTVGVAGNHGSGESLSTDEDNGHANVSWASTDSTTKVTAIVSGTYVLQNNRSGNYLGNTSKTYTESSTDYAGLALNGTGTAWTITQVDGGYYIQDSDGKYLSVSGSKTATVTSTPTLLQLAYDTDTGFWTIAQGSFYLNGLGGATSTAAGGYTSGTDAGSQWNIYPTGDTTTITVTGVEMTGMGEPLTVALDSSFSAQITVSPPPLTPPYLDTEKNPLTSSVTEDTYVIKKLTISTGASVDLDSAWGDGTWSIADTNVATVDSSGNVTAVAAGETTLTFTADDGSTYTIPVTVMNTNNGSTSGSLMNFYVKESLNTTPYYSITCSTNLIEAQEGELIYLYLPTSTAQAFDFFAKPNDGYALTSMSASNTKGQYMSLNGDDPTQTHFYTENGAAGANQVSKIGKDEVTAMVQAAMNLDCQGGLGYTLNSGSIQNKTGTLTFGSAKLPTVNKEVAGVLNKAGNEFRPYEEGMEAVPGEKVYFWITVTKYGSLDSITYTAVDGTPTLTDSMAQGTDSDGNVTVSRTAYFTDDTGYYPTTSTTRDIIDDLMGDGTDGNGNQLQYVISTEDVDQDGIPDLTYRYTVVYTIQAADVDTTLKNKVEFAFNYQSQYASAAFDETSRAEASIEVAFDPGDRVIDFGLPVEFTFTLGDQSGLQYPFGEVKAKNGEVSFTANADKTVMTLRYTPKTVLTTDDIVTITSEPFGANNETRDAVFHIIPASNMLYEETFLTAGSGWTLEGTTDTNAKQSTPPVSGGDQPYGYDSYYNNAVGYSGGTYYTTTVSETSRVSKPLTTTFYGSGFDLIGNCGNDTAVFMLVFQDLDGNGGSKAVIVDTRLYNDELGTINQTPMGHVSLTESTYKVSIFALYIAADEASEDGTAGIRQAGTTATVDGFRVYRGTNNTSYDTDEQNATYVNVLEAVSSGNLGAFVETLTEADGTVTITPTNYEASGGPQDEIYLSKNQFVVLSGLTGISTIQVSARAVTGTAAVLSYDGTGSNDITLTTNTEMYYEIPVTDGTVTLTNKGDGMLALSFVKIPSSASAEPAMLSYEEVAEAVSAYYASAAVVEAAPDTTDADAGTETGTGTNAETNTETGTETVLIAGIPVETNTALSASMLSDVENVIEETIPAPERTAETAPAETKTFEPDTLTLDTDSYVLDGQKYATLTVTASTDVDTLTINGVAVWASNLTEVLVGEEKLYRYSYLVTAKPGETVTFTIVVTDKYGRTSTYTVKG